jgi:hypothetical protein
MVLICANDPPRGGFFVAAAVTGATGRIAAMARIEISIDAASPKAPFPESPVR